jgi:hypothetical protein
VAPNPAAADLPDAGLLARAAGARARSAALRRDARAAQWRASGTTLVYRDVRLGFAWLQYRTHRLLHDLRRQSAAATATQRSWRRVTAGV